MKTLSQGRIARLRAAVDRYEAIDFDEPLEKRVKKTASKCTRQYRMPRPSHGLPLLPPFPLLSDSTLLTRGWYGDFEKS